MVSRKRTRAQYQESEAVVPQQPTRWSSRIQALQKSAAATPYQPRARTSRKPAQPKNSRKVPRLAAPPDSPPKSSPTVQSKPTPSPKTTLVPEPVPTTKPTLVAEPEPVAEPTVASEPQSEPTPALEPAPVQPAPAPEPTPVTEPTLVPEPAPEPAPVLEPVPAAEPTPAPQPTPIPQPSPPCERASVHAETKSPEGLNQQTSTPKYPTTPKNSRVAARTHHLPSVTEEDTMTETDSDDDDSDATQVTPSVKGSSSCEVTPSVYGSSSCEVTPSSKSDESSERTTGFRQISNDSRESTAGDDNMTEASSSPTPGHRQITDDSDDHPLRYSQTTVESRESTSGVDNVTEVGSSPTHVEFIEECDTRLGIYCEKFYRQLVDSRRSVHMSESYFLSAILSEADVKPRDEREKFIHDLDLNCRKGKVGVVFDEKYTLIRNKCLGKDPLTIASMMHEYVCPTVPQLAAHRMHDEVLLKHYELLNYSVNDQWIQLTGLDSPIPGPNPAYCVGFDDGAFTREQLWKLQDIRARNPIIQPSEKMHFPFLTFEVQPNVGSQSHDRVMNFHNILVAATAMLELFDMANMDVNGQVLAFSVGYTSYEAYLHMYWPKIANGRVTVVCQEVHGSWLSGEETDDLDYDARYFWRLIREVHEMWVPVLHKRLRDAIDAIDMEDSIDVDG